MRVTSRTKMREFGCISAILRISDVDLVAECSKFDPPREMNGVELLDFDRLSFWNLAQLWDCEDKEKLMYMLIELFAMSQLTEKDRKKIKDTRKWCDSYILGCSVIDFYSFILHTSKNIEKVSELFSSIKVEVSDEEKQAGYGSDDRLATQKTILAFARDMGVNSIEEAENRPWGQYYILFKAQADEANRQRRYSKILNAKNKIR